MKQLHDGGGGLQKVSYVAADMTDFAAVQACVAKVVDLAGPIDVLVANAGTGVPGYFLEQVPPLCLSMSTALPT